jgi:hypothetical protein
LRHRDRSHRLRSPAPFRAGGRSSQCRPARVSRAHRFVRGSAGGRFTAGRRCRLRAGTHRKAGSDAAKPLGFNLFKRLSKAFMQMTAQCVRWSTRYQRGMTQRLTPACRARTRASTGCWIGRPPPGFDIPVCEVIVCQRCRMQRMTPGSAPRGPQLAGDRPTPTRGHPPICVSGPGAPVAQYSARTITKLFTSSTPYHFLRSSFIQIPVP